MKRHTAIITLVLLGLLATAPAVLAAAPSSPFSGTWIGQEPVPPDGDGSIVYLVVKGGTSPRLDYQDNWGTVCWEQASADLWFSSALSGSVSGTALIGTFRSASCGHLRLTWMKGQTHTWVLNDQGNADPSDDTLWDRLVTWRRV